MNMYSKVYHLEKGDLVPKCLYLPLSCTPNVYPILHDKKLLSV